MPEQWPNDPDDGALDDGALEVVEPMSLAEQIAGLRQLASDDPETTLFDLAIINMLDELAEAVQELRGGDPP